MAAPLTVPCETGISHLMTVILQYLQYLQGAFQIHIENLCGVHLKGLNGEWTKEGGLTAKSLLVGDK